MMKTEVERSADKAAEQAKRVEERMRCKPVIDLTEAFKASLRGGNHGVARLGAKPKPEPTVAERCVAAVEKAAERHREEGRVMGNVMSDKQRYDAAQELRESADRIERGF
jgi:hypothetical protein